MSDLNNYKAIPEWVWHPRLQVSPGARLVLICYIYGGILETGWVRLKQEYVAKLCGISVSTLCVKQRELEQAGVIRVVADTAGLGLRGPSKILLLPKIGG